MAEYIELEPLRDEILNDTDPAYDSDTINHFLGIVDSQPTADVVEVVRCKECEYLLFDTEHCKLHNRGYCKFDDTIKQPNHFCSYGTRKEGADNG